MDKDLQIKKLNARIRLQRHELKRLNKELQLQSLGARWDSLVSSYWKLHWELRECQKKNDPN